MGDSSTEPRLIANTNTETMEFVQCFDDEDDDLLARRRHADNVNTLTDAPPKPIIPTPLNVEPAAPSEPREVRIDSDWRVVYDSVELRNEAVYIASKIQ